MVTIKPSTRADKKYMAIFKDGTVTHFGAKGFEDFTTHRDEKRKELYIKRHRPNEDWTNPKAAGTLARFILWNLPTLSASIADYKKRFNL
jgi:hypothetical protein